ncbi:MAG: HEAT repeat domain-containing protein [Candidatus Methanoperedens sp.]
MVEQPEIHRKSRSKKVEERKEAAEQLGRSFAIFEDKEQAWEDLHELTQHKDDSVRWRAANSLGAAFSAIPEEHKHEAWADLHELTEDKNDYVRWGVAFALGAVFSAIPEEYKHEAWADLIKLTQDKDDYVRRGTAEALGAAFSALPEEHKHEAWTDLIKLMRDIDDYVRRGAANSLSTAFSVIPEKHKHEAWADLHELTEDKNNYVRWGVAFALGVVFSAIPEDYKHEAWTDLIKLTRDKDDYVRRGTANSLSAAFSAIPKKHKHEAWADLHKLKQHKDNDVRRGTAEALGAAFSAIPEEHREEACQDLIELTQDKDDYVRRGAASALGAAFSSIPEKHQDETWADLHRLTSDDDRDVRASAYHSLGKASIFKATNAVNYNGFKKLIEEAIGYFENSTQQEAWSEPAKFCLPFYRSFYAITFRKEEAEADVKRYIDDAKGAVEGSKSKEKLLEAVENLSNALKEAQKAKTFDESKFELNAYRKYCERAADLITEVEDSAPGAAGALRRGLPIIDERIKGIIGEIQEKTKEICKTARGTGTPYESLGKEVNLLAGTLSEKDYLKSEKSVSRITNILGEFCKLLPEDKRGHACEIIKEINEEEELVDRLSKVELALTYLQPNIEKELQKDKTKEIKETERRINIPFEYDLISVINDNFSPIKQKEVKKGSHDAESKTLEFLRTYLHGLVADGRKIQWLDVGCGNGRSLHVLKKIEKNLDKIYYNGTDCSDKCFNEARECASKFKINASFNVVNAASMNFKNQYDVVSAILLLHEVDPLYLPYVLINMLRAIKKDGTIVISDFEKPFEQERDTVTWNSTDIETLLSNFSEAGISVDKKQADQFPEELEFYQCYIKNPNIDEEKFTKFIQHGFKKFLESKKNDSIQKCDELESQITKRVCDILKRPYSDIGTPSDEEMKQVTKNIDANYGIKAHKVVMLTRQIKFLYKKINELKNYD